jgi:hypothetical protein
VRFTAGTEAPCWATGDHHWYGGSICVSCGERLRCLCGRFWRADDGAHFATCPALRDVPELEEQPA